MLCAGAAAWRSPCLASARRTECLMADWYVVQVRGGQENAVVAALRRTAGTGALEECFSPRWRTQRKIRGEWQSVERLLLPGYVVAVTDAPRKLDEALRRVPGFARLLRNERGFAPLDKDEVAWIGRHAQGADRVIPLSKAVKAGDEVVVVEGPLKDRWFRVKRIDRRRATAYVEMDFLGRRKEVPIGLMVVAKQDV